MQLTAASGIESLPIASKGKIEYGMLDMNYVILLKTL